MTEYILPLSAEIPKPWIIEENEAEIRFVTGSRTGGHKSDPKQAELGGYIILMLKETRQMFCRCRGYQTHGHCFHLNYLMGYFDKPIKQRGVQDTSLEAFFNVQSRLGRSRRVVLEAIRKLGPVSNKEIAHYLDWEINCVTPRVNELRTKVVPPLVEDAGKAKRPGSKLPVHCWRAVGALP